MLLTSQIYENKYIQQKKMNYFLFFLLKMVIFLLLISVFSLFYLNFVISNDAFPIIKY